MAAWLLLVCVFMPMLSLSASASEMPAGLIIRVPDGVEIVLYNKFNKSGDKVAASERRSDNGVSEYCFYDLPVGNYSYTASGKGYYTVTKNLYYSKEKAASVLTIEADPGKKAGNGFEPTGEVSQFTDEVIDTLLPSSMSMWAEYAEIFEIPSFSAGRAAHQMTTQREMMAFLRELDEKCDRMKMYVFAKSPMNGYEIPVVVFSSTDISSAETVEDAARMIEENGKVTIQYQAMMHGNEPAGSDAALSMIRMLCGSYGDEVLGAVNIYIVPRVNVDGAYKFQRKNAADKIDINRDHMLMVSEEITALHGIYNLFSPEVVIDGHEYSQNNKGKSSDILDDVKLSPAISMYNNEKTSALILDVISDCFSATQERGLRAFFYDSGSGFMSSANYAIGREYYGLAGSLSFLIETNGIGVGLGWYARRIMSQYTVAETIIDYVVAHEREIRELVDENRRAVIENGAEFEDDDLLILQHGSTKTPVTVSRPKWKLTDGSTKDINATEDIFVKDTALRTRTRPTAYVIGGGETWTAAVLELLDKHGIRYYEIDAGSAVMLRQYKGDKNGAELTPESEVSFDGGAFVIPMDQSAGNVIAMLMEPDVIDMDGYNGTLVQSEIIKPDADGMLPIYRYEHDLAGGKVKIEVKVESTLSDILEETTAEQTEVTATVETEVTATVETEALTEALPAENDRSKPTVIYLLVVIVAVAAVALVVISRKK